MESFDITNTANMSLGDYAQMFTHLLSLSQMLCKQAYGASERLCQEVILATQGRARLLLRMPSVAPEVPSSLSISFPIQFHDRIYGTLEITPDTTRPTFPALPLSVAHLLAHICGWLLYTVELSAFMEGQLQRLSPQIPERLTKREREVLALICRGYDQQVIAKTLCITLATVSTHRKHIYEKLGVHNERDLPLAAYQAHLFSILDESNTDAPSPPVSRSTDEGTHTL
ncbi:MAG: helix-turn-helix transcriptional regulator [Ktedonobacteraceae bacterium]|nr:helix-turn-helix transcriptional regulator [Ktedonobacteraceae bacterium]